MLLGLTILFAGPYNLAKWLKERKILFLQAAITQKFSSLLIYVPTRLGNEYKFLLHAVRKNLHGNFRFRADS